MASSCAGELRTERPVEIKVIRRAEGDDMAVASAPLSCSRLIAKRRHGELLELLAPSLWGLLNAWLTRLAVILKLPMPQLGLPD